MLATLRTEESQEALSRLGDLVERVDVGPLAPEAVEPSLQLPDSTTWRRASSLAREGMRCSSSRRCVRFARGTRACPHVDRCGDAPGCPCGRDVEQLARAAAVLGASFEPGTVAGLLDVSDAVAARRCEQLVAARLAVESGRTYEFANDLVHEVLYATTPEPTRHTYHRKAADLLDDHRNGRRRTQRRPVSRPGLRRTGSRRVSPPTRRFALPDADRLFTQSLVAAHEADSPELVLRAFLERGRVRESTGGFHAAMATSPPRLTWQGNTASNGGRCTSPRAGG